jgi:hypothetical protein
MINVSNQIYEISIANKKLRLSTFPITATSALELSGRVHSMQTRITSPKWPVTTVSSIPTINSLNCNALGRLKEFVLTISVQARHQVCAP